MPSKAPEKCPVFLVGYRCTGKTTIGRLLAQALARPFVDTDKEIETLAYTSIAGMVKEKGWEYFRKMETQCLSALSLDTAPVVATGGGIILAQANREMLKARGFCIWLTADEETVVRRMQEDKNTEALRPHLTDDSLEAETKKMLAIRNPLYEEVADFSLDTATCSPEACTQLILRRLVQ